MSAWIRAALGSEIGSCIPASQVVSWKALGVTRVARGKRLHGMRPRPEEFERLLRKLGVCQDEHLVIAGRAANVKLVGRDTRADSISRAIARDRSKLFVRARLVGHHERSQGHLDCRGMVVSSEAEIHSIPELDSEHAPRARLSHDVAVGPIDEEAIAYLITRGVDPDEATAILTRGFLEEHSEVFAS